MKFFVFFALLGSTLGTPTDQAHWRQVDPFIVGGDDAEAHEFPYIISLRLNGAPHNCGGSILDEDTILTAAHCVDTSSPSQVAIAAGVHYLTEDTDGTWQVRAVRQIIVHPDYQDSVPGARWTDDIALLKLATPLEFNDYVQPISLPPTDWQATGPSTAIGWGRLYADGPLPDVLQKIPEFPIIRDDTCQEAYTGYNDVHETMLCAGGEEGKNVCNGDSGSPLVVHFGTETWVVGIASWTMICAIEGYPGVYTEVSHFNEWIAENRG